MKSRIIVQLIIYLFGIILGILIMVEFSTDLLIREEKSKYGFEETVTAFKSAVTEAGWVIPAVHDLQKSMADYGAEVNKVKVFAVCYPEHAVKILSGSDERIVSSMMPCYVSIYEKEDNAVYISMINSKRMSAGMERKVRKVMKTAYQDMEEIISGFIEE
jgi:uncharacterized protein (DUF302 family)